MTSSILPPRSSRADCSPSTQRTASETFDLPHPLGPTIAVTPSSKVRVTESAKDLKPESSSRVSFMRVVPLVGGRVSGSLRELSSCLVLRRDDERRHADLPAGLLRLIAGGIGTEHDPVGFVALLGREH